MRKKIMQLLMLPALLLAFCSPLAADEQGDAVNQLVQLLADVHSVEADFEQLSIDATGASIQQLQGRMLLKKPGRFVWITDEPMPQELYSDGEKIWLYDPDLLQVTVQSMDERMTHTPALLLSGEADKIHESFEVFYHQEQQLKVFTLLPKDKDTLFDRLRIGFSGGLINEMHLEDAVGQKTSLYFFSIKTNQPLDDSRFVFEIPDGVDVIEE